MLVQPTPPAIDHRPFEYGTFDLGLIDTVPPTDHRLSARATLHCRNANYDRRTIAKRLGMQRVCENSPGARQVADFEPDETWIVAGAGGTGVSSSTPVVAKEVSGTGTRSRLLTITGTGPLTVTFTNSAPLLSDLSGHPLDVFSLAVKRETTPAQYRLTLEFESSPGNFFAHDVVVSPASLALLGLAIPAPLLQGESANEFVYYRMKRHEFTLTGTPTWSSITKIRFTMVLQQGTLFSIRFDNLTLCPGRGQDLIQFRRLSDPTWKGAKDEYAVVDGHLYRLDEINQVWTDLGLLFDPDAEVNHAVINDRLYLCDGISKNRKVMPDGATVYQMGIDALTAPLTAVQVAGGGSLADGTHHFAVTYFSAITGIESAPHQREGQAFTISGGSGVARVTYSGLPRSPDPQVTHLRIYRRSPTGTTFNRVGASLDGEVLNGVGTFTEGLPDSQLGKELDPDLDAPGPALFFSPWPELGVLLGVFAATPTVVNFSSPVVGATPENWRVDDAVAVGRDDNDSVSGLHYDGLRALVFKANAVLEGVFVGGEEFIRFRTIRTDRGSLSHKGILTAEKRTYYPGSDGLYAIRGGDVQKVTALAQGTWNDLVFREQLHKSCAVQLRSRFQVLLYFQGKGAAQNDLAWKLHHNSILVDRTFSKGLGPGHTAASAIDEQGALAAAEVEVGTGEQRETWILSADGQVYRIDAGTTDDGRPIRFVHRTALLSPAGGGRIHRFPYLDVETKQTSNETMTVKVFHDFTLQNASASLSAKLASDDADLLGAGAVLGTSVFGFALGQQRRLRLPSRLGRRILFQFEHEGIGALEIYGLRLWAEVDGQ